MSDQRRSVDTAGAPAVQNPPRTVVGCHDDLVRVYDGSGLALEREPGAHRGPQGISSPARPESMRLVDGGFLDRGTNDSGTA